MKLLMNDQLNNSADKLIIAIKESLEYQQLMIVEEKINQNQLLLKLITDIKSLQQKNLINPTLDGEQILNLKIDQLNQNKIYSEYLEALKNFNQLTKKINQKINQYINNVIELK